MRGRCRLAQHNGHAPSPGRFLRPGLTGITHFDLSHLYRRHQINREQFLAACRFRALLDADPAAAAPTRDDASIFTQSLNIESAMIHHLQGTVSLSFIEKQVSAPATARRFGHRALT
jgi:hypothetical protein